MSDNSKIGEPSKFWKKLAAKNVDMLSQEGLENLKRTVANNYYNWAVFSVRHGLFPPAFFKWLSRPDFIPFKVSLPEMEMLRKQQSENRIEVSWLQRHVYRLYVGLAWSVMLRLDPMKLSEQVSEPEIGNPFPARLNGRLISQDLANSIIECNTICGLIEKRPLRILEVGGGYGRLAHVFTNAIDCTYHIVDIEPAKSVARWYLERVSPTGSVVLHSPEELAALPDGHFDVVLSISTLPEMSKEQVDIYIGEFQRLSREIIFLKQWKSWLNPEDGMTIDFDSYRFGPEWINVMKDTDPLNTKFFNAAWNRL